MRRADRLFQLIQYLRSRGSVVTAQEVADFLEVSIRTVYRDVADLVASGVPIDGERGVGYMLRRGFELPPLMFDVEEIEALVLGAAIVRHWSDDGLASAARRAVAKIEAALPEQRRAQLLETALFAPPVGTRAREPLSVDLAALRRAIRARVKVRFQYTDSNDAPSERVIRPLGLAFYGPIWLLMAWCELRDDFRTFRVDRMTMADVLPDPYVVESGKTIEDYFERQRMAWNSGHP